MKRHVWLIALSAILLVLAVGCSKSPSDPTVTNDQIVEEFGGYTATNESPAFGDPTLAAQAAAEVTYDDTMEQNPQVDTWLTLQNFQAYHFRAVWGHLVYSDTVTAVTDWTGSLDISYGAALLRRVIRFEERDSILPRTDYHLIEWASHTRPHFDGIAADLIIPTPGPVYDTTFEYVVDPETGDTTDIIITVDTLPAPTAVVTFTTPQYSRTFTLDELVALDTVIWFDDSTAVAFTAFQRDEVRCPRGILSGTWGYDENGDGVFRGTWISRYGFIDGFVEGKFGLNDDGKKIFYGKWIDATGQFEGLLRGYWAEHPNEHASDRAFERAGGWFRGQIFTGAGDPIGGLKGRFKSSRVDSTGYFAGIWRLHCPDFDNDGEYVEIANDFRGELHQQREGKK